MQHYGHLPIRATLVCLWAWQVLLEPCMCCNSVTTEPIHSKLSSLELSWPVHLPIGQHGHAYGHNKGFWNLEDARTQQSLGHFTPNQVQMGPMLAPWTLLSGSLPGLYMCSAMVICSSGPHGRVHGCDKCSWKLVHRAGDPAVICLFSPWFGVSMYI